MLRGTRALESLRRRLLSRGAPSAVYGSFSLSHSSSPTLRLRALEKERRELTGTDSRVAVSVARAAGDAAGTKGTAAGEAKEVRRLSMPLPRVLVGGGMSPAVKSESSVLVSLVSARMRSRYTSSSLDGRRFLPDIWLTMAACTLSSILDFAFAAFARSASASASVARGLGSDVGIADFSALPAALVDVSAPDEKIDALRVPGAVADGGGALNTLGTTGLTAVKVDPGKVDDEKEDADVLLRGKV